MSDVTGEDDGVLGALGGRGPQSNGVYGTFSFAPGNLGFGHTGKTASGKDAHMAYLMLRHLKLRHIRRSVSNYTSVALLILSVFLCRKSFSHEILTKVRKMTARAKINLLLQ